MTSNISSEKELSVEQAFTVCVCFFWDLWEFIDPVLPPPKDIGIHAIHYLFSQTVCGEALANFDTTSSAAWNEAIFRAIKISKEDQKKIKLSLEETFLCMIEFCKIYNYEYESKLKFLIELLDAMKLNPNNHLNEWTLLKKNFLEISSGKINTAEFDWNVNYTYFFKNV